MFLAAVTLAGMLRDCAPNVSPATMTAIVRVESGGNTLALHDNSLNRSFAPSDTREAVAWTNQLIALGHSVDIGLSQINNANLPRLGLSVSQAFDPCINLRAGGTILGEDYRSASHEFGPGQYALRRALGAYNTGSIYAGQGYVNEILEAAGLAPDEPEVPALASAPGAPAPIAPPHPKKRGIPGTTPVQGPAYTVQHTAGSPVVVLVGN